MNQKATDEDLARLRKYITDEAERLEKCGAGVVCRIDLDEIEETPSFKALRPVDPLERDIDLLFGSTFKRRRSV